MKNSTILVGRNYLLLHRIKQLLYYIEIFNLSFLKNHIEKKDGYKFDKIMKENFREFR